MSRLAIAVRAGFSALIVLLVASACEALLLEAFPQRSHWPTHVITIGVCAVAVFLLSFRRQLIGFNRLQHEKDNFKAVVEHLPGLACIVGEGNRFLQWNSRFQEALGYSARELREMKAPQTIAEDYRKLVPATMGAAFTTGSAEMEAAWVTRLGKRIPCYLSGVRILVNEKPCVLSVGIDLSRRKQAEEASRKSEELYRQLLANLPDVTWTVDSEWGISYISPNVESVLGYTPGEIIGGDKRRRLSRVHPDDAPMVERAYNALFLANATFDLDYRMLRKDDRWVWVRNRALRTYQRDGVLFADGILTDVTERKHAEQADAQLASIVHSSREAIIGKTADGTIVSWNPAAEAMFGYSAPEAVGKHVSMLIPPERMPEMPEVFGKIARGEQVQRFDSACVRKDGTRLDVSLAISPIMDKTGTILGISTIAHDIGLRKHIERELLRAKVAAEAATRAKTEFLANVSHELRTPMNGILGMTELALDTELDAEQREYLLTIQSSGNALLRLISGLLDFTKIESGALQLNPVTFNLGETVRQTLRPFSFQAQQVGLEMLCEIDPSIPDALIGDPERLRQILVNLVGNAIKFTHQGSINVRVVGNFRHDKPVQVLFMVSDTGIGIPPQKHGAIFEPFTQSDGSSTRKYGGAGMGLAISSRLVKLMGGRIWVESDRGQGSTFKFTLNFQRPIRPEFAASLTREPASTV
ncbi:MAG: PAS domain S-box protein [Candidatus Korobacteraceae bacterium]